METTKLLNFLFEQGHLKRVRHEGWRLVGVENPETVAAHALRVAQIAYILAKLDGYANPAEVCALGVFHDIGEARVGDIHKVANRYITADEALAVAEQTAPLGELGAELRAMWEQTESRSTRAGILAKDADVVELAITAREYQALGYPTGEWIASARARLQTEVARQLVAGLEEADVQAWWQDLKKFD